MEQCNLHYKTMHHKVEKRVSSGLRAVKGEYDNIRDRLVNEERTCWECDRQRSQ